MGKGLRKQAFDRSAYEYWSTQQGYVVVEGLTTQAVQSAINIAVRNHQVVLVPPGVYSLGPLTVSGPCRIVGAGPRYTQWVFTNPASNGLTLAADDIQVEGVGFQWNTTITSVSNTLVYAQNQTHLHLEDFLVVCTPGGGTGILLANCDDTYIAQGTVSGSLGGFGITVQKGARCVITQIRAENLTYAGGRPFVVEIYDTTDAELSGITARSLTALASMTQGAGVIGVESTLRTAVINCLAVDAVTQGSGNIEGIIVDNAGAGNPQETTITNCVTRQMTDDGIDIFHSDSITVADCISTDNKGNGIEAYDSAHVTLSGNHCLRNKNQGIKLYQASQTTTIANQCRENASNGISWSAGSTAYGQAVIGDNQCLDNNQGNSANDYDTCGISIQNGGTDVMVRGNLCRNTGSNTTQAYGVGLFNSGWAGLFVENNDLEGNATADLYDGAKGDRRLIRVTSRVTLNGTSAGNIQWQQSEWGQIKRFTAYVDGYENDSTTNQTVTFPYPYLNTPDVAINSSGLTLSASTTTFTISAPDNTTKYSGVVEVVGI